jgi:glycosyltransferase involved in cell wall biosynthesis
VKRPFRLLMTADAVGGVWQYSLDLARFLTARNIDVRLALLGPAPSAAQSADAAAIAGLALIETGEPLDWLAVDRASVVGAGRRLAELAEDEHADLVHLNSPALGAEVRFASPALTVAHSCLGTWWEAVRDDGLPEDFAWRDALHAQGLARAAMVVTPSRSFARATAARHRLPHLPRVVHNGRSPLPCGEVAMHDFAFTAGRLWDAGKNVATLDRAAGRLAIPFKAAGRPVGENGEVLASEHLALLGQLDEAALGHLLGARPVFASAALYEPFGLAVLEAAAAGCPLVLSDIPTFRELWDDVAVFVAPNDDRGFAGAIDALVGDTARRIAAGEAARERARRYGVAAMGEAMLQNYRTLLRQPGARAAA